MSYHELQAAEVRDFLAQPDAVVLDLRDMLSYARGHIDGARRVDDQAMGGLLRRLRRDPPVLVYCYHGHSSRELARFLTRLGFTRVYNLEGGWQAWAAERRRGAAPLPAATLAWAAERGYGLEDLNERAGRGMTALMTAAREGRGEIAAQLLEAGADPNLLNDDRNNALWFACHGGDADLVRLLIDYDTEIDNRNVNGATCLIYAASAGKEEIVKILVEAGADLGIATVDGYTALDSAATPAVLRYLRPRFIAA